MRCICFHQVYPPRLAFRCLYLFYFYSFMAFAHLPRAGPAIGDILLEMRCHHALCSFFFFFVSSLITSCYSKLDKMLFEELQFVASAWPVQAGVYVLRTHITRLYTPTQPKKI
ncbi:hypothetical protein F5Y03DRAFT_335899 [Xylaria venustula]|nr:hypothetical protein F5Y03DRAFT_335899 [Xylaria venustula]